MSYTNTFFENQSAGSRSSADKIAPIIFDRIHPRSVVDIGCGVGTWLAAFREAGADDVLGFDGDYVNRGELQIETNEFRPIDFLTAFKLPNQWPDRRFDLALSLEVGEHLPQSYSYSLARLLTQLAPAVLFSAAIPRQSGTDHVNERWQSEWAATFAELDFYPHDVVRPKVWDDGEVEPWYAQNILLYLPEKAENPPILDLVHPRLWEKNLANSTLRAKSERIARHAFWSSVERVAGRR